MGGRVSEKFKSMTGYHAKERPYRRDAFGMQAVQLGQLCRLSSDIEAATKQISAFNGGLMLGSQMQNLDQQFNSIQGAQQRTIEELIAQLKDKDEQILELQRSADAKAKDEAHWKTELLSRCDRNERMMLELEGRNERMILELEGRINKLTGEKQEWTSLYGIIQRLPGTGD